MARIELKALKHAGVFAVTVHSSEQLVAPYSKKQCLWYDSLYVKGDLKKSSGFTHSACSEDSLLNLYTDKGLIEISSKDLMPYLSPSFTGQETIGGEEVNALEYCIESDRQYFGQVTSFRVHLPPFLFIPISHKVYLLNLYDAPPVKGKSVHPLIPTFRGRTG